MKCARCKAQTTVTSTSWFNTDVLCPDCQEDERHCPNFALAKQAEERATSTGDYNFPGIGLTPEDWAALRQRMEARRSGVIEAETLAYDVFSSLLKQWMVKEKLGHDSIMGRARAEVAYCNEMEVKEPGSYWPHLRAIVQQFLALLTDDTEYIL